MDPFYDIHMKVLFTLSLYLAYVMYCVRKKFDKQYPPFAPGSMWKHFNMASSSEFPWWLLDESKKLHTQAFQLSLPTYPIKQFVVIGDHSLMRAILMDSSTYKPDSYKSIRKVAGGPTILGTNGHGWYAKRKASAPAFSSNHVKRMTRVALENTETWIQETLRELCGSNSGSFDVGIEMVNIIIISLAETAFDFLMSKQEASLFRENLDLVVTEFIQKTSKNPLRSVFGLFLPERQRALQSLEYLHSFVRRIMAEYRKKEKHLATRGTIIQMVMESDAFPTDEERLAQLMEFLLVGHDTTAYSISWILLCLAKHPDEQTKLRHSLDKLSSENWRHSEVLMRVIKEGMRLYPVARSVRMTGRDILASNGMMIPKGSLCSLQFLLIFRNPNIFHQPDSYIPSRWENPTREMIDAFNPFSLGGQNCLGRSLAQAETHAVVARICSEFELSVESEGASDFGVTLKPVGLRLKACKV